MENKKRHKLSPNQIDYIVFIICLFCVFLFMFSAYEKITDHSRFESGLSKVEVLKPFAGLISWAVPVLEIAISLLLIIPGYIKWGLYSYISLMTIFTFYILSTLLLREKLPCHCNLIIEKLSWSEHLWFNLLFIGLAALALKLNRSNGKLKI